MGISGRHCNIKYFHNNNNNQYYSLSLSLILIYIFLRFFAHIYKCNVTTNVSRVYAISVTLLPCDEPFNFIQVSHKDDTRPKTNFTICLSPLHTKYNDMYKLVEFLEVHRILGVDKIVTYIESIGPNLSKVINYYRKKKFIDTF